MADYTDYDGQYDGAQIDEALRRVYAAADTGDMKKTIYDTDDDGVVDRADLADLANAIKSGNFRLLPPTLTANATAALAVTKKTALDSTVQDNTEYRLGMLSNAALTITLPAAGTAFECWIKFTMPTSGTPSVTFAGGVATWIGKKPAWAVSKTYEISIKDHVIVAAEVGDGT